MAELHAFLLPSIGGPGPSTTWKGWKNEAGCTLQIVQVQITHLESDGVDVDLTSTVLRDSDKALIASFCDDHYKGSRPPFVTDFGANWMTLAPDDSLLYGFSYGWSSGQSQAEQQIIVRGVTIP